ncbi:MAG: NAD-dependent epimerase/dehydratase family protein [Nanoarchaeota archaeon]
MKSIVVTGGAGFIGSHLVELLVKNNYDVTVIDNLSTGNEASLIKVRDKITFLEIDITNKHLLGHTLAKADGIVHLAARTSVPESIKDPSPYITTNVLGTQLLLSTAHRIKTSQVVLASSAAVYGKQVHMPLVETCACIPLSPYAVSKHATEDLGTYFTSIGLGVTSLRFFNIFGSRQNPNSDYTGVITRFITAALAEEPLIIYGNGEQTRDFVHVHNVCEAILAVLNAKDAAGVVINIGNGTGTSINNLAKTIIRLTESSSQIIHEPGRIGDIMHSVADITMAQKLLNYKIPTSFETGLQETIDYYRSLCKK